MTNDTDIDAFVQWFRSNGGIVDTEVIGVAEFPGSGRGAIALCDIPDGYSLFTLPRTITLSTRTSPLPALFGFDAWRAHRLHKGWVGLILCMMWEDAWAHESEGIQGQGNIQTKWGPYMRTLPTIFETPMFWSAEELEELRGTSVVDKIGREDAERAYSELLVPAIQISPTLFPPSHHGTWYTLDAYHRAGSRILSRSFAVSRWTDEEGTEVISDKELDGEVGSSNTIDEVEDPHQNTSIEPSMCVDDVQHPSSLEGINEELDSDSGDDDDPSDVAMVPMADLLNARWGSENAKLFHEPLVLRMVTTRNIKQGEQIFNTYGDLPNSDLLRRYGHVDLVQIHHSSSAPTSDRPEDVEMEDGDADVEALLHLGNPSDVVEVRADLVVHVAQTTNRLLKAEDMHARIELWLDEGGDDTFVLGMPEPGSRLSSILPPTLISLTRLVVLSEPDFQSGRSKGKLPKGKLKSGQDDEMILKILDEVFRRREEMYVGGNVEDDERLLSIPDTLTERKQHAVIVRLAEKRILRDVRQTLRAVLAGLRDASKGGNEKGDMRSDKKGGKGGKEMCSGRKRAVHGAEGGPGWKKARK